MAINIKAVYLADGGLWKLGSFGIPMALESLPWLIGRYTFVNEADGSKGNSSDPAKACQPQSIR